MWRATIGLLCVIVAAPLSAQGADGVQAPKPLFRDPVFDGAADPTIVWDRGGKHWLMFYTNRRATLPLADPKDVSWVHGTAIGIARSDDGAHWTHQGTAAIPARRTGATLWAPEVQRIGDVYHMWLTVVPGVFKDWNASRHIVHLTSSDLKRWKCGETLDLGSDRVIDATVAALPRGGYRLWFKDERQGSKVRYADSSDLIHWTVKGTAVETRGEGPKIFQWRGKWWLIEDAWAGLLVLRSDDLTNWTTQEAKLLAQPGLQPSDPALGQHPDVVVSGDRAFLYYFTHQRGEPEASTDPRYGRRTVMQVAELREEGGIVSVDREAPVHVRLSHP